MNVHHLAALLVRLTGLILLLRSLETAIGLAMAGATDILGQSGAVPFLTFQVLWLTAGILLLLFPNWIAGNIVPAPDKDSPHYDDIPSSALASLIVVVAGLYFIVDGVKALASLASYWAVFTAQGAGHGLAPLKFWTQSIAHQTITGSISLVVGLLLLLRPHGAAAVINRLRRVHPKLG